MISSCEKTRSAQRRSRAIFLYLETVARETVGDKFTEQRRIQLGNGPSRRLTRFSAGNRNLPRNRNLC
jgi:hypothetical protein